MSSVPPMLVQDILAQFFRGGRLTLSAADLAKQDQFTRQRIQYIIENNLARFQDPDEELSQEEFERIKEAEAKAKRDEERALIARAGIRRVGALIIILKKLGFKSAKGWTSAMLFDYSLNRVKDE